LLVVPHHIDSCGGSEQEEGDQTDHHEDDRSPIVLSRHPPHRIVTSWPMVDGRTSPRRGMLRRLTLLVERTTTDLVVSRGAGHRAPTNESPDPAGGFQVG